MGERLAQKVMCSDILPFDKTRYTLTLNIAPARAGAGKENIICFFWVRYMMAISKIPLG
jgi:hypothetical protein